MYIVRLEQSRQQILVGKAFLDMLAVFVESASAVAMPLVRRASILARDITPYDATVVRGRSAPKDDDNVVAALSRDAVGKSGPWTAWNARLATGRGPSGKLVAILARSKPSLNAFDNRIKTALVFGRVNQREAVNQPPLTAEDDFLINGFAISISRQHKPVRSKGAIVDAVISIGIAPQVILVTCRRLPVFVGQRADQQLGPTVGRCENFTVSPLGDSFSRENVGGVLEAEPVALVAIGGPTEATVALAGGNKSNARSQKENGQPYAYSAHCRAPPRLRERRC